MVLTYADSLSMPENSLRVYKTALSDLQKNLRYSANPFFLLYNFLTIKGHSFTGLNQYIYVLKIDNIVGKIIETLSV